EGGGRREEGLPLDLGQTAREPTDAALARITRGRFVRLSGNDVIKLHDDVGAEVALDLHHRLGSEESTRSVDVGLEFDAVFIDGAELGQRKNLEATGVGENRTVPAHEVVKTAHRVHD